MTASNVEKRLRSGLERMCVPVDEDRVRQLLEYLGELDRWNRTYNLTAVRKPEDMVTKHILDSLSVLPWIPGGRLLDAGAGAGLPGIPLAIANPGLVVTLVDSAGKKVRFLKHVARSLGLANIEPIQCRVESLATDAPFEAVISRAFTHLAEFAGYVRHLAGEGTRLLAMKGRYPAEEIEQLPAWAAVRSVEKLTVPGLHEDRHLVIMSVNP